MGSDSVIDGFDVLETSALSRILPSAGGAEVIARGSAVGASVCVLID